MKTTLLLGCVLLLSPVQKSLAQSFADDLTEQAYEARELSVADMVSELLSRDLQNVDDLHRYLVVYGELKERLNNELDLSLLSSALLDQVSPEREAQRNALIDLLLLDGIDMNTVLASEPQREERGPQQPESPSRERRVDRPVTPVPQPHSPNHPDRPERPGRPIIDPRHTSPKLGHTDIEGGDRFEGIKPATPNTPFVPLPAEGPNIPEKRTWPRDPVHEPKRRDAPPATPAAPKSFRDVPWREGEGQPERRGNTPAETEPYKPTRRGQPSELPPMPNLEVAKLLAERGLISRSLISNSSVIQREVTGGRSVDVMGERLRDLRLSSGRPVVEVRR